VPSAEVNEVTRGEWRELGFFYERDDALREWRLRGSREGLLGFSRALIDYVRTPRRNEIGEHDHFGPYMYLTIGTFTSPQIDAYWIAGTPRELEQLGRSLDEKLLGACVGEIIRLRGSYCPEAPYEFTVVIEADDFDPAKADPYCW